MAVNEDRLQTELSLLNSMYPDQILYNDTARELKYNSEAGSFTLRLPSEYLTNAVPEVLSANAGRSDLREQLKQRVDDCNPGEEVLDSIVLTFDGLVAAAACDENKAEFRHHRNQSIAADASDATNERKSTMIVWLHHLLNTKKRKQALSPASSSVSGVTKPGYPGVLIYCGPSSAVHEHVNALKALNWQAFQVRLESDEEWSLAHGPGVIEVESMKEAVAEIEEAKKDEFLEAMRMK